MNNYNILLASPDNAPGVLCSASSIMWQWNALVKGENLTGKHFNQPPDGPYGSWYGHYKAPLEDPFASTEAPACPRVEEQSESIAEPKFCPVPMVVMKQILKILKACPKGISITDFRSELGKSNIQTEANGQFFLRGAASKVPEPGESSPGISTGCTTNTGDPAEPAPALSPKINDGDASCRSTVHEKPSTSLDAKVNAKEPIKKVQGTSKRREDKAPKVPDPPPIFDNMSKAEAMGSHMHPVDNQEPISEVGFFSRVWRKWFGGKDSSSEQKTCGKPENCSMLSQKPEKSKETNEKFVKSAPSRADQEIINWCKFWRSREMRENPSEEEESRKGNQIDIDAEKQEIFTRESFWNDVASFIQAPKGSNLVFQSRTRKQMAENLQKQGPAVLITLSQNDLLHLVDLLISDKKWVEECPLQTFPFKVIHAAAKSSFSNASSSNGLSSLFNGTSLQSSSRIVPESGKQRLQNPSHVEVSPLAIDKELSSKSRGEILADCQKLVDGILKEYPEGFNTASFRKLFLDT
ncbi:hypothetical protein RJ639_022599 [Escallonia herrerae]|uniref:OST-HTH associated domain-containing protein n=1 Tax=Escallonia herrerae TaxID=1293975 RepID=A0AA88V1Q4_9ASTE|nr:hypothetical protein RJ639_022599 [Escallonia herrerae]